jgi:hypothetical protein
MNVRTTASSIAVLMAAFAVGCGGSASTSVSTAQSVDPQVFKQNAQTYLTNVRTMGSQLASCVTRSLANGALGGGQQSGSTVKTCIATFTDGVKRESEAAQSATATYLKGVTSPCKEKVQIFNEDVRSLTALLSKDAGGNDTKAASKLITSVGSSEVQGKLVSSQVAFNEMTKTCADLAPSGN